jgi:hypothetical protein
VSQNNKREYKYYREPWMRLTIRCWRHRSAKPEHHFDVGKDELLSLIDEYERIEVTAWGVYSQEGYKNGTPEHKQILEILERCK